MRTRRPEPFPLLVDGVRTGLPALHVKGSFASGLKRAEWELWGWTSPFLKTLLLGCPMARADLPDSSAKKRGAPIDGRLLEGELVKRCRIEIPGVYFAFGTAAIDPISTARWPSWRRG